MDDSESSGPTDESGRRQPAPGEVMPEFVGRYRVIEKVGEGGMGIVYKALDPDLDRYVALKFLPGHLQRDTDFRSRFEQEARAASALDHPNIGYIHEIGETEEGRPYIAMAYYEGETLAEKLKRGPLGVEEARQMALQIAEALSCAHDAGIVHRDLKPGNIIVGTGGHVRLVDFGLAKVGDVEVTEPGTRLGTTMYSSPEQLRGENVDHRTDIWSFGVIYYEMLTGERPFTGDYDAAVMYSVCHEEPKTVEEHPSEVPAHISELVLRCLEKNSSDRYSSMREVQSALEGEVHDGDAFSSREGWISTFWRPSLVGSAPRLVALGSVAFILLLIWLWPRGDLISENRHLAVLPFDVIGEDADAQVYSAGLMATLTSRLTQLEQFDTPLWVVPASEVDVGMSARDAQQRFGITMAVTGTVQVDADRVRVTVNLIDAATRRQIGSEQIDSDVSSVLAMQDAAALALVRMLRLPDREETRVALTAGSTVDQEANALYLRGWGHLQDFTESDDLETAINLFRAALEIDPKFALAYAALAEALWQKYGITQSVQLAEDAIRYSERALELNNTLAPVHITQGIIHAGRGQYEQAVSSLRRALQIDDRNAEAYMRLGSALSHLGAIEDAEVNYRRAISLKPDYWRGYNSLGAHFIRQAQFDRAVEQFEAGLKLAPANPSLLNNVGVAHWSTGRLEEASAAFEGVLQVNPGTSHTRTNLATVYFYNGRYEEAAEAYAEVLERWPENYTLAGFLGDSYYWADEKDRADEQYRFALRKVHENRRVRGEDLTIVGELASYHARLGQVDSVRTYLNQIERELTPDDADLAHSFGIGEVYETIGDRANALRWMSRPLEEGHGWMQVQFSPWLSDLREDPVVRALSASNQFAN